MCCSSPGAVGDGDDAPENFNMPHHCYEYHNTLAWFWDNFDHPRRLRLLFVAASFPNRVAGIRWASAMCIRSCLKAPSGAGSCLQAQLLDRVDAAICSLNGPESVAWTQAYCDNFTDRGPLVSASRWPRPNWATIRTIRKSPSAC